MFTHNLFFLPNLKQSFLGLITIFFPNKIVNLNIWTNILNIEIVATLTYIPELKLFDTAQSLELVIRKLVVS